MTKKKIFFAFTSKVKCHLKSCSCFHCLFLFSAYKIGFERFPVTLVKTQWVKQPQEGLMATKTLCEITVLAASVNQAAITPHQGAHVEMLGSACSALTALPAAGGAVSCAGG